MITLSPKTKKLLRIGLVSLGTVAVAGILAWFTVINPYLTRKEKQRFESAAVELEKLSQEIQTKFGSAAAVRKIKFCDRPNLKFQKGPLSCDVTYELDYALSAAESNQLINRSAEIGPGQLRKGYAHMEGTQFIAEYSKQQAIFQDYKSIEGLKCTLAYIFANKDTSTVLTLSISCGEPARSKHYPLKG